MVIVVIGKDLRRHHDMGIKTMEDRLYAYRGQHAQRLAHPLGGGKVVVSFIRGAKLMPRPRCNACWISLAIPRGRRAKEMPDRPPTNVVAHAKPI